jgi:two-component system, LytTR family, sensor histidine kinase AgrC
MNETLLADLFIFFRAAFSTFFVFSLTYSWFSFKGVRKKLVFLTSVGIGLLGCSVLTLLYHFLAADRSLLNAFYFPCLVMLYVGLILCFFHHNPWYTLFCFSTAATGYLILNVPTEILLLKIANLVWANSLYLGVRLICWAAIFSFFFLVLRKRLLSDEGKIGKQFVYPFLLSALLLFLLAFIGLIPTLWYQRDSSVYYLMGYCFFFVPAVYFLIGRLIQGLLKRSDHEKDEIAMSLKIQGMEQTIRAEEAESKAEAKRQHDLHHHIDALKGLLAQGKTKEAETYLESYQGQLPQAKPSFQSGSYVLDSLLGKAQDTATKDDLQFTSQIQLPSSFPLKETEIISLFANLLENALKGAKESHCRNAFINLEGEAKKGFFRLQLKNSSRPVNFRNGLPLREDKTEGLGSQNVADIVNAYSGFFDFSYQDNVFTVQVAIPLERSH